MLEEERLRVLRWFSLEREDRGDVTAVFNCLMGRGTAKMATPSNRHKLQQGTIKH